MTITCQTLDDLLFDATPLAMETAEVHARGCTACAERLAEWQEISDTARSMKHEWRNEMLWPRIERSLRVERPRRSPWLWQIAAAIAITVALGATMAYSLRSQNQDAAFDRRLLRVSSLDRVDAAEKEYVAAISQLEELAGSRLEDPEQPLMVSYREKLMLLDDAIAECEQLIRNNRQNAHIRRQLLAMYTEKQRTLENVLREETDVNR
ncbi:MAG TPA: hypothetical protein VF701_17735 [Thermoanaerobaculia bacterium]